MKNMDLKDKYADRIDLDENNDLKSALENNEDDEAGEQGSSGVKNVTMGRKLSPREKKYKIRKESFDRDEENPMYSDGDQTWTQPEDYRE